MANALRWKKKACSLVAQLNQRCLQEAQEGGLRQSVDRHAQRIQYYTGMTEASIRRFVADYKTDNFDTVKEKRRSLPRPQKRVLDEFDGEHIRRELLQAQANGKYITVKYVMDKCFNDRVPMPSESTIRRKVCDIRFRFRTVGLDLWIRERADIAAHRRR